MPIAAEGFRRLLLHDRPRNEYLPIFIASAPLAGLWSHMVVSRTFVHRGLGPETRLWPSGENIAVVT